MKILSLWAALFTSLTAFAQADFTIVALPDTQYYAKSYPTTFNAQMNWIVQNQSTLNIQLVVGLGDIVDNPNLAGQLTNADTAYKILDAANVPYFAAIGNHDYANGGSSSAGLKRIATAWNSYFGPSRYASKSFYGGNFQGSNENFWGTISLGGQSYLVLVLEFYPRNVVLTWAGGIMRANSSLPTIIVTHSFLYGNARVASCDNYDKESYGLFDSNDGEQMWQKFVSQYPNIQMVLSGHVIDNKGVGTSKDYGIGGNLVNQIFSDYQNYPNGGNGYLRIMQYHPALNRIDVTTYSPTLKLYMTDSANKFSVPITAVATGTTATVKGKVESSENCGSLQGAAVTDGQGHTVLTDQYGNYTLAGIGTGAQSITASFPGRVSQTNVIVVNTGSTYTSRFVLNQ